MKNISIDLETYSSVNLAKTGVYRYAEAPDFEILLFGYSVDGGEVHVIDVAGGETIPADIIEALTDETVTKWAYNANFERICLSRFLGYPTGKYLDPASWRCSMVWSATMGLPLSLEGSGAVLGLEKQKLTEGKELIRYFCMPCKPTAANGQRTRNLPSHAPDRWEMFKAYNACDVETEMSIQTKLAKFPVPESVWAEYCLDQEINDRGVALDTTLVREAITIDSRSRTELTTAMQALTELDNPNSVQQMKRWLADNGLETDTLGKKNVAELLKTAPPELARVLALRQQLAKSSVRKYQTMENAVCSDGRARGMFQFYGANRTGRWSGRLIQMQNLVRNSIPDLEQARALVRSGNFDALEMLYEDVPDTLSQLIRTAFIPKAGNKFIVADFSAIEARVIAWLAGERWRQKVFAEGGDIYCMSASTMFHVPVEKHGVNGHLRQKGKISELACIAEGQLVLTDHGLVPIEKVSLSDLLWDGSSWVRHGGVVFKGEREVIEYEGLTATPDHLVWAEGQREPIQFGLASASGAHLLQTGIPVHLGAQAHHRGTAQVYDIRNAGEHHRFTVSGHLVHNCGYGGSVGALKAMGALEMGLTEDELPLLVDAWRQSNPNIVKLWWDIGRAAMDAVRHKHTNSTHGITFSCQSGMLFITLPSGRRLAYVKPRIGENKFGGSCITYEGVGATKKWERLDTYGPKIVENCLAEGTQVLTNRGVINIEDVRTCDLVWDGIEWVNHEGVVCRGTQPTVSIDDSIRMTPDHKILTQKGWVHSFEAAGLEWAEVSFPHGTGTRPQHTAGKNAVGLPLRLRNNKSDTGEGFYMRQISGEILRMHEMAAYKPGPKDPRNEPSSCVRGLALHETALRGQKSPRISQLRRSRHLRMSRVAAQFRPILERYGANLSERFGFGQDRQQRRLYSGKLQMDHTQDKCQKQTSKPCNQYAIRHYDGGGACGAYRHRSDNAVLPARSQLADRIAVRQTGLAQPVYDIRNCGSRHRFAVYDPAASKLRLVSNCTQAISRDILSHAMQTLRFCSIVMHIHDEVVIEADPRMSLPAVCEQMSRTPLWAPGLLLSADGYECSFYKKD